MDAFEIGNMTQPTCELLFQSRKNSFTFLRFAFAMLVIIGHSFVLGGFGDEPLTISGVITGREFAVQAFFAISGFLIAKSLATDPSLWRFVWHRIFRVYPAFLLFLLLAAFALVPWAIERQFPSVASYWDRIPTHYISQNWALQCGEYQVVGVFSSNPNGAINGSLWSIKFEAYFYVSVAACVWASRTKVLLTILAATVSVFAFFLLGWSLSGVLAVLMLGAAVVRAPYRLPALFAFVWIASLTRILEPRILAMIPVDIRWVIWPAFDRIFEATSLPFIGGGLCWQYRGRLPWTWLSGGIAALVLCVAAQYDLWLLVMPVALPYLVLVCAFRLPFHAFDRLGDYSYGLYIFSFPVQQTLFNLGVHRNGVFVYAAVAIFVTLALAVVSWYLVEKPCLALGRKVGKWRAPSKPSSETRSTLVEVA